MCSVTSAVVSFNTKACLRDCLTTLLANDGPGTVVVVDNGSTDGSIEMVQREFPDAQLIINRSNAGYGAALNRALAVCSSKYLIALNSDTLLPPDMVQKLSEYLDEHTEAAIVAPRLRNADGSLQRSCKRFPATLSWLFDNRLIARVFRSVPLLRDQFLNTWAHDGTRSVPYIVGAAFALRVDAAKQVAGFDESFFMYYEETDLCYRLEAAGWQVHFAPVTDVIHLGGESTKKVRDAMTEEYLVSNVRFYRKHYKGVRLWLALLILKGLVGVRWLRDSIMSRVAASPDDRARAAASAATWRRFVFR
jgi:GT2 family glycosyltransferase